MISVALYFAIPYKFMLLTQMQTKSLHFYDKFAKYSLFFTSFLRTYVFANRQKLCLKWSSLRGSSIYFDYQADLTYF